MNAVTFNDPFERPMKSSPNITNKLWDEWSKSPLFTLTLDLSDGGNRQLNMDPLPLLPFPMLRCALHLTGIKGAETEDSYMNFFVRSVDDGWHTYLYEKYVYKGRMTTVDYLKDAVIDPGGPPGGEIAVRAACHFKKNAWVHPGKNPNLKYILDVLPYSIAAIGFFAQEVMMPTNRIVSVEPADERRSVEWTQARTHYTIITHDHPANNKAVERGSSVTVDDKKEISRMAHNRRAHYKTLTHERYRFARGQRIFVKAAWVGPREWKDAGGKQIYKILTPVEDQ